MAAFREATRQTRALGITQAIRHACVFCPVYVFIYSFTVFSLINFTKRTQAGKYKFT